MGREIVNVKHFKNAAKQLWLPIYVRGFLFFSAHLKAFRLDMRGGCMKAGAGENTRSWDQTWEEDVSAHCSLPIETFAMINNFQCTHSHRWSQVQRCQFGIREKWLKRKSPPLKIDRKTNMLVATCYVTDFRREGGTGHEFSEFLLRHWTTHCLWYPWQNTKLYQQHRMEKS